MSTPRVSVIVAAHDAAGDLPSLLAALEAQTLAREELEVLVIDDASRDATAETAAGSPVVTVLRTPARGGAYVARNVGLEHARGRVLAFTDADCVPAPDWLERGLEELDALGADLIAGHIEVPLRARPSVAELLDFGRHLHQERNAAAGFGATANLLARREVFDRIGPFNAALTSGGDRELGVRAQNAGLTLRYSQRVLVVHEPRRRARALARKAYRLGMSRAQLERHGDPALGDFPPLWRRPGAWAPGALLRGVPVYGSDRLAAAGITVGRLRKLQLALGEWAWVQIPLVVGNIAGSLRERRLSSRDR